MSKIFLKKVVKVKKKWLSKMYNENRWVESLIKVFVNFKGKAIMQNRLLQDWLIFLFKNKEGNKGKKAGKQVKEKHVYQS